MLSLKIKVYRLKEFPENFKITNQGNDIKRFVFELKKANWTNCYTDLKEHLKQIYNLSNLDFSLYYKDDEEDIIKLSNDNDIKSYCEFDKTDYLKLYLFDDSTSLTCLNRAINEIDNVPDVAKEYQFTNKSCNECKKDIKGIGYASRNIDDFDLCETCFSKTINGFKNYVPTASNFGFITCKNCFKEIKSNNLNDCLDCTNNLVPILNKACKNKKIRWDSYTVCDSCKSKNHSDHSFKTRSVLDVYKSNKKLINEIISKRNKGQQVAQFLDYGSCANCFCNSVSYRSTSFKYENLLLCTDCLERGAFINMFTFTEITNDDVNYKRGQKLSITQQELLLKNKQLTQKQKIDFMDNQFQGPLLNNWKIPNMFKKF